MNPTKAGAILAAALLPCLAIGTARAGNSFSNSLAGFTGDTSLPATQAALTAAGFEIDSTSAGAAASFGAGGASFGTTTAGDGGRNYLRTLGDYSGANFQAFVTVESSDLGTKQAFFGLGRGQIALFGVADWSTQFASTFVQPEATKLTIFYTNDDVHNNFVDSAPAALSGGVHRLRMTLDSAAQTMEYAVDLNYAGGPFASDAAATVSLATLFGATGWPGERSEIYFGGDDGVQFRDFAVTVVPEPASSILLAGAVLSLVGVARRRSL